MCELEVKSSHKYSFIWINMRKRGGRQLCNHDEKMRKMINNIATTQAIEVCHEYVNNVYSIKSRFRVQLESLGFMEYLSYSIFKISIS